MCMYALPLTTSFWLTPLSGYWLWKLINIFSQSWFSSVHLLSRVWPFVTPWTAALQASLSFTISQKLLKLTSIESVMPSNHMVLCRTFSSCLWSFPASGSFRTSVFFASGGQSIKALASVLPMTIKGWLPLGLTGWSWSLRNSQESSPAPQFKSISSSTFSLLYGSGLTSVHDCWKNNSFDCIDLCWQNDVSAF